MAKVRVLPDVLASQVAAGEVVERPASVVKELVENSLDAGATRVEVRIDRGGISLIRVIDDGCGMSRDDALMALERHATSKIRSVEDLAAVTTLGFRGEALPSIASVSRFSLATREHGALTGTRISVEGGRLADVVDAGEAPGSQIEVRQLFFNVPARRKFLRTEATEFSHIEHQVRVQAIAHPGVGFSLVHNDRLVFRLPPGQDPFERIRGLVGAATAERLVPVDHRSGGIGLEGFAGEPGLVRSRRDQQLVFVNRRPVDSPVLQHGLREGYRGALPKGHHPVAFLFLTMNPEEADINVHPAKREVRFRHGNRVRDTVAAGLRQALAAGRRRGAPSSRAPGDPGAGDPGTRSTEGAGIPVPGPAVAGADPEASPPVRPAARAVGMQGSLIPAHEQHALRRDWLERPATVASRAGAGRGASPEEAEEDGPQAADGRPSSDGTRPPDAADSGIATGGGARPAGRPRFEWLGVLDQGYAVLRGDEGLVLLDQRSAHERILYERLHRQLQAEGVASQQLLVPITLELGPRDFEFVVSHAALLERAGVGIEAFGANTVKIDHLPAVMRERDPAAFIDAAIRELEASSEGLAHGRLGDADLAAAVSRIAVRHGDVLRPSEVRQLVDELLECEMPYCSPRGNPTLVQIGYPELDRRFGRRR